MPRPLPEAAPISFRLLLALAAALALADPAPAVAQRPRARRPTAAATRAARDSARRDSVTRDSVARDSVARDSLARDSAAAERLAEADSAAFVDPVSVGPDVQTPAARVGAYLALVVGPILFEELTPLGAGAAASQRELALWPAIAVMTLGGWASTGLLYALGRWRGVWLRRRFPRAEVTVEKLLGAVQRRPWRSALAVRYAVGLRVLLPMACGVAHVPAGVYLLASFVSSVTWSVIFGLLGYWFGQAALAALRRVEAYNEYAVGVLAGAALVGWLVWRRRRRQAASRAPQ